MKKILAIFAVLLVLGLSGGPAFSGDGPAPNSGDGVSDGSGMDSPNGPQK